MKGNFRGVVEEKEFYKQVIQTNLEIQIHTEQSTQCSEHSFSRKERMAPFSYSVVSAKKNEI